jgi:hypothetical protein
MCEVIDLGEVRARMAATKLGGPHHKTSRFWHFRVPKLLFDADVSAKKRPRWSPLHLLRTMVTSTS